MAIGRVALRERNLPTATLDGPIRDVRLLVDHREDLVAAPHPARAAWTVTNELAARRSRPLAQHLPLPISP
jgi:hypothetical protein